MQQISTRFNFALELLESLVKDHKELATSVVVCSSRDDFFNQILLQLHQHSTSEVPSSQEPKERAIQHPLLVATLDHLAASSSTKLVYCPSLPILRACLSGYAAQSCSDSEARLVILDMIALHHGTSEFTLQGLSRTLATAASAAHLTQSDLRLVECKDIADPTNPDRGPQLWDTQVPLLSGSIKIGPEGSGWAGRAIIIRKIAARWFSFDSAAAGGPISKPEDGYGEVEEMLI